MHTSPSRPAFVIGVVLGTIFVTEFAVMLALTLLHPAIAPWVEALIDASILSLTVSGVILWAVARSGQRPGTGESNLDAASDQDTLRDADARGWKLLGLLLGTIFLANAVVMLLLGFLPMGQHGWQEALIHATGSALPIAGAIWWLVVSPIKRAARAQSEAEARLTLALNNGGIAVWDVNAEGDVWLSEQWEVMLGGERRETRSNVKDLADCVHPEDRRAALNAAIKVLKGQEPQLDQEHRVRTHAGGWRWISLSGQVVRRSTDGRVLRMSGTTVDITNRKQAEMAHAESESRNQAVIDAALDAIIVRDSQGHLTAFNPAAERTFGYRRQDVIGKPLDEFLVPGKLRQELLDALASGTSRLEGRRVEFDAVHADGHEFPIEVTVQAVNNGGQRFVTIFCRDISERKRAEDALLQANTNLDRQNRLLTEASRAKTEFMAAMSHELRTPLNGIIGFAELLQAGSGGGLNAQQADFVTEIQSSGEQLLDLIDRILEMTRADTGYMLLNLKAVNVAQVLADMVQTQRTQAARRHINMDVVVAPEVGSILINPWAIGRMIEQLLSNAIKFSHEGGRITLSARQSPGCEAVEISIADTGIGIAREEQARLFKPFVQLDASLGRRYGGAGIGLTLVHRIAVACGGSVEVQSEPGKGSVFTLRLPVEATSPGIKPARPAA